MPSRQRVDAVLVTLTLNGSKGGGGDGRDDNDRIASTVVLARLIAVSSSGARSSPS
jgi:hypothetical protein